MFGGQQMGVPFQIQQFPGKFPQVVNTGVNIGPSNMQEQINPQFQYLDANVPKNSVLTSTNSGQDLSQKQEGKKNRERDMICGKCKNLGHISKDCKANIHCAACNRDSHTTVDCTVLKQPKPIAKYVGYGAKGLGGFAHPEH